MTNFETSHFIPKKFSKGFEDSALLNALIFCYSESKKGNRRSDYQRIITAIKFRNQSERLEYKYKQNVRIILMAAAFEALFNLPDIEVQTSFSNSINILLGSCNEELVNWAKDFYKLRSDIVHGNISTPNIKYKSSINNIAPHVQHYRIAKNIFDESAIPNFRNNKYGQGAYDTVKKISKYILSASK